MNQGRDKISQQSGDFHRASAAASMTYGMNSKMAWKILRFVVILAAVALFVGGLKSMMEGRNKQLAKMQADLAEDQAKVRQLRAEVAFAEQPERIEAAARQKLGMVPVSIETMSNVNAIAAPAQGAQTAQSVAAPPTAVAKAATAAPTPPAQSASENDGAH